MFDYVARLYSEPFLFQSIPTFRVHLPGNLAVGAYHRDSEYGHPAGSLNFWVPLTPAAHSNSFYLCEDDDPRWPDRRRAIRAWPGDVVVFDAVARRHGNQPNLGNSRVSFDFRCLPVRLYRESGARSVNMGCRFAPGDYYAAEPCEGRQGSPPAAPKAPSAAQMAFPPGGNEPARESAEDDAAETAADHRSPITTGSLVIRHSAN